MLQPSDGKPSLQGDVLSRRLFRASLYQALTIVFVLRVQRKLSSYTETICTLNVSNER